MRLAPLVATITAVGGFAMPGPPAPSPSAPPAPSPSAAAATTAGVDVCTIDDPRAVELSGLVATVDGYVSVVDSQFDQNTVRIIYLDKTCKVTRTLGYPSLARDPEDIAVGLDGTLWVADTGDNMTAQSRRQNIAVWQIPSDGGPPVIYRLTYPDGPHDAEALLFDATGMPIIVTKELAGPAGLYRPTGQLVARTSTGVALERVGSFRPTVEGDDNPFGALGENMVTGAATTPDRSRIALRTYAAAYEWNVPDGDVVKAITTGTPRITRLAGEPQGEAIAYTVDGLSFLTLSDVSGPTTLRRYQPVAPVTPTPVVLAPPVSAPGWTFHQISWYAGILAGIGLSLLAAGLFGVAYARGLQPRRVLRWLRVRWKAFLSWLHVSWRER